MAITSQYDGKCKDCGTEYKKGDQIDTNGNKSKNKNNELKDHWCKNGLNCTGVNMQLKDADTPRGFALTSPNHELTGEELKTIFLGTNKDYLLDIQSGEHGSKEIIANYIGCKMECERHNIVEGVVQGMIFNNYMENKRNAKRPQTE
jgi:hypothetical protein